MADPVAEAAQRALRERKPRVQRTRLMAFRVPTDVEKELVYKAKMEDVPMTKVVVDALREGLGLPELVVPTRRERKAQARKATKVLKARQDRAVPAVGEGLDPACDHAERQVLSYMTRCKGCGGRVA